MKSTLRRLMWNPVASILRVIPLNNFTRRKLHLAIKRGFGGGK